MSVGYKPILWNRQKRHYDRVIFSMIVLYFGLFVGLNLVFQPEIIPATLIIRATGILGILMLHVILAIGPLARLNPRFLPLLYNRRHLGVSMFLISAIHGIFSIIWFHGQGNVNPIYSLFTSNMRYDSLVDFPFQVLGFFALLILFLMAASSHDFWLKNLSPKVWKSLHMLVYGAYFLLIMHVMLGALQVETSPYISSAFWVGMILLIALHLRAGAHEAKIDNAKPAKDDVGWVKVGEVNEIPENRAKIVCVEGERIAVFKYSGKLSAISNVCKHQNGPLGEGKIVDGCITCPWHGYQYLPQNGQSPPPFTEKVATFQLKLVGNTVFVNPEAFLEGTEVEPVNIP
jgi:methionine sulfoxide reductase heme-binding subunit